MKVLMVSCLMAVTLIGQIQAAGYGAVPYPSYPSNPYPSDYSTHSADKSSEEQSGGPYSFGYHVKDDSSYNQFGQQEKNDDRKVSGSYYVNLPDGHRQSVNYKDGGYVAGAKYPSAPSYTKYKREIKYNYDAPSYPVTPSYLSTLFYPTIPSYPSVPSYPKYEREYNHDPPSYTKYSY